MSTPSNVFSAHRDWAQRRLAFQRVISVNGSENIYSVLSSTLLDILGVGTE